MLRNLIHPISSYRPKYSLMESDCMIFYHQNILMESVNVLDFFHGDEWWNETLRVLFLVKCCHACLAIHKFGKTSKNFPGDLRCTGRLILFKAKIWLIGLLPGGRDIWIRVFLSITTLFFQNLLISFFWIWCMKFEPY